MLIDILNRIKKLPQQTEDSLNDALGLLVQLENIADLMEWNRWVRREAMKLRTEEALEIVKKTYFFGAKHSFDEFMVAMEWNREPQARFWLPRRKVLEGKQPHCHKNTEFYG